jgi:hypothetical protein
MKTFFIFFILVITFQQVQSQTLRDSLFKKYNISLDRPPQSNCYNGAFKNDKVSFSLTKQKDTIYTPAYSIVSLKVIIKNNDTKNIFIDKYFRYSLGNENTTWSINILYKDSLSMVDSNTESSALYGSRVRKGMLKLKPNETAEFIFTIDFNTLLYHWDKKRNFTFLKDPLYGRYKIYINYLFLEGSKRKFCLCADTNEIEIEYKEE